MHPGSGCSLPGRGCRCGGGQGASLQWRSQPRKRVGAPSPAVGLQDGRRRGSPSRCGGKRFPSYLRAPGRAQAPQPGPLIRHRRERRRGAGPGSLASSARGRLRGQGASRKSRWQPAPQKWGAGRKGETRSAHRAHRPPKSKQPLRAAATGKQQRPFRWAKTAKTATAPTYSTQARPQTPVAYRNGAPPKRGRKLREKPIRSLRGGATR